jgi:hypothetical protein
MQPKIWGRYGWNFIHLVTVEYPNEPTENDKINYQNFFNSLQHVLPCKKCKEHIKEHMSANPLTNKILSTRMKLILWTIDLHNIVNKSIGKKELTYIDALNEIENLRKPSYNYSYLLIATIAVLAIVYVKN